MLDATNRGRTRAQILSHVRPYGILRLGQAATISYRERRNDALVF
jgi:hypothetical protein